VKKGDHDRAIDDFGRAIELNPDSIFILNNRGAAYARKREFDLAIADFNEAIRLDPSYAMTFDNRGVAYAKQGRYERAIEDFDRALQIAPGDAGALNNRKLALQMMQSAAGAEAAPAIASNNDRPVPRIKRETPAADTAATVAVKNRDSTKQLRAADKGPKIAVAPKSRAPSALKSKSKVQLAAARPHRPAPSSRIARFFRNNPLIPGIRKVLRLASHR
jgi:tetratricopeptide (TPR) repeat protein